MGTRILCAAVVLIILCGVVLAEAPTADRAEPSPTALLVAGNNAFACDLYAQLREQDGNLFLSPYSISTALAMTYAGARGDTEAQMGHVLNFALRQPRLHRAMKSLMESLHVDPDEASYELSVANALWGQKGYGFLEEFLKTTREHYGAGLQEVDFAADPEAARRTINTWVEERTREKIKELLLPPDITRATTLVLTNAIYFRGDWASKFDQKDTREASFAVPGGRGVQVTMMHQTAELGYLEAEGFQALEMPYAREELSMVVLLPREADGLSQLEEQLTHENLTTWIGRLRRTKVRVWLPKFSVTTRFELQDVLQEMGMTDAFTLPPADFSGMTGDRELCISKVIHKAFVDVNEEGTEAAAATAVVVDRGGALPPVPAFRADHPFLFLIRDRRTGSILFMGRVTDPTG